MFVVGSLNNLFKYEDGIFSKTGIKANLADKNYYVDLHYNLFRDDHIYVPLGSIGRRLSKLFVLDNYVMITDGFGSICVLDKNDKIIICTSEEPFRDQMVPVDIQINSIRNSTTMPGKEVVTVVIDGKAYMQRINTYETSGEFLTEEINATWFRKEDGESLIIVYKRKTFVDFFESNKKSKQFRLFTEDTGLITDTIYFNDRLNGNKHQIKLIHSIKKLEDKRYIIEIGNKSYFIDNGEIQLI
jgi:hypothetical protein